MKKLKTFPICDDLKSFINKVLNKLQTSNHLSKKHIIGLANLKSHMTIKHVLFYKCLTGAVSRITNSDTLNWRSRCKN